MRRLTIVGAGRVGEAAAQILARQDLVHEIVLIDVKEGAAAGVALDIQATAPLFRFDTRLTGTTDPAAMAGSALVVITAGVPRKPGMSRSDVLDTNVAILDDIMDAVRRHAPQAIVLVVSNPVDVLTWRAWQRSGWPRGRVLGQAGVLDSSRMAAFIALETGLSAKHISAMVLGGHGDAMVPLLRYTTVSGIGVEQLLDAAQIERIIERTRHGGAEVLALRKNSSAYDAPGAAIAEMVEAILLDRKAILPTVAVLDGEYDQRGVAIGVPCVLGRGGVERIVPLDLSEAERRQLAVSAAAVRKDIARLPAD